MFPGQCFNEFPLSTSEDMTQTFNGDIIEKDVHIEQDVQKEIYIEQQKDLDIYIDQQVEFTLEN